MVGQIDIVGPDLDIHAGVRHNLDQVVLDQLVFGSAGNVGTFGQFLQVDFESVVVHRIEKVHFKFLLVSKL